jgi:hypothetical protein
MDIIQTFWGALIRLEVSFHVHSYGPGIPNIHKKLMNSKFL